MSTKDRSGTLPVNAYEEEIGPTEIFNFFQLQDNTLPSSLHEETSTNENREQETTSAVAKKGDFAFVVQGYAPKVLATKSCPFFYRKI